MDSFEINKIIAAILVVFVVVFGISKISNLIYHVEKPNKSAYKVEIVKSSSSEASGSAERVDISTLLSMGSADEGKKIWSKCSACHSIKKGGKNKIGPALYSVLGRNMAALSDYKYSKALISYGKTWSFDEMNAFLTKPQKHIKGTKMAFAGLKKEKDRASIILYMNQNSDNPLPLP